MSGWSEFITNGSEWFGEFGLAGLGALSFTEAFIQPIPPDMLVIPMAANSSEPSWLVSIFVVVTVSSVLGSLVAWWMGDKFGNPLLERFASPKAVAKFNLLVTKYGTFGIFIAAFSPIPYKVLGWCAGIGKMDKSSFLLAGLVGRSLRFGVEIAVVGLYGEQFLNFLIGPGFIVATLAGALLAYPAWRWWDGLDIGDEEE